MTIPPAEANGLRVGFVPGVTVTKWQRIWIERFPRQQLDIVEVAETAQRAALDTDQVDMCFVRLPVDTRLRRAPANSLVRPSRLSGVEEPSDEHTDRLHIIRLYDEVPVVVMALDHPLAKFETVTQADIANEAVLDDTEPGAVDRVAWNGGILRVPHSVARTHSRRDLVYRPISDAEPTTIALAWPADAQNSLIDEFVGIVRGRTVNSSRTVQERAAKKRDRMPQKGGQQPAKTRRLNDSGRRRPRGR